MSCSELKVNENFNTALIDSLKKSLYQNSVYAYFYLYGRDILNLFERNINIIRNILESYKMGNQNVPSFISRNYFNLGDYQNSYLWRIRCTITCVYNVSVKNLVENSVYIEKLTTEQIKNIQEAALKKEILKI